MIGAIFAVLQLTIIPIIDNNGKDTKPKTVNMGPGLFVLPGASNAIKLNGIIGIEHNDKMPNKLVAIISQTRRPDFILLFLLITFRLRYVKTVGVGLVYGF